MFDNDRAALDAIKGDRRRLVAELRAAGAQLADGASQLRCPFHADTHASAGIHEHDGTWWFTCHSCEWNNSKGTGDVFAVVMAGKQCDFHAALEHLGVNGNGRHGGNGTTPKAKPTATDVAAAQKLATDSAARLTSDAGTLDHLWRTRGIDRATAEKLGLGVTGKPGRRYTTMPIVDAAGKFVATKFHRLDGQSGSDKGK